MEFQPKINKNYYNIDDICKHLHISHSTVIRDIQKKNLDAIQVSGRGSQWIIKKEAFCKYIEVKTLEKSEKETKDLLKDKNIVDISSIFTKKQSDPRGKPVTCRVTSETLIKIDKERAKSFPIQSRSAHLGEVLDELYVHRKA